MVGDGVTNAHAWSCVLLILVCVCFFFMWQVESGTQTKHPLGPIKSYFAHMKINKRKE